MGAYSLLEAVILEGWLGRMIIVLIAYRVAKPVSSRTSEYLEGL